MQLKSWWNKILHYGPLLGYYPKPSKSWLITKLNNLATAEQLFNSTEINITTDGQKYLGGYIGSDSSKAIYMQEKINKWIKQLEMLSMIAKHEPQAAYSSFTAGFKHRFTYHTRVMSDIDDLLKQIDHIIDTKFLPAITEEQVISPLDRKLISLPIRLGGLGIPIFSEMSNESNSNSKSICAVLINEIKSQNEISSLYLDIPSQKSARTAIKQQLNHKQKHVLDEIRSKMSIEQKLANDISQLKGSSSWLTSLPLAQEGYVLNKREFFDAIAIRYRWNLKRLPSTCPCSKPFTLDHAVSCLKGGFVHRRHNEIRDIIAKLLRDVSPEVQTEPILQPLTGEELKQSANKSDEARLDIATRGYWQRCEMAFFDVRIFNPFAKSYRNQPLSTTFALHEKEKKRQYNQRVIQVEHGSFTPLVFSAYGGTGRETHHFLNTLINRLADKSDVSTSIVANYVRTSISFAQIRALINCVRGTRSGGSVVKVDMDNIMLTDLHKINET